MGMIPDTTSCIYFSIFLAMPTLEVILLSWQGFLLRNVTAESFRVPLSTKKGYPSLPPNVLYDKIALVTSDLLLLAGRCPAGLQHVLLLSVRPGPLMSPLFPIIFTNTIKNPLSFELWVEI